MKILWRYFLACSFPACSMFLILLICTPALAQQRKALIIGNSDYLELSKLGNTLNDTRAYSEVFADLGFDVATSYFENLTLDAMDQAIDSFVATLNPQDQVVVVYSGHGWSDGIQNFLIPTDAPKSSSLIQLRGASYPLSNGVNGLFDKIKSANVTLMVAVIDACRNNPFILPPPPPGTKSVGTSVLSRGLVAERAPEGSLLIFSARPGEEALDGLPSDKPDQKLSVFTRFFLPQLSAGGPLENALTIAQVQTMEAAATANGHLQRPNLVDETIGNTCLKGDCSVLRISSVPPVPAPSSREGDEIVVAEEEAPHTPLVQENVTLRRVPLEEPVFPGTQKDLVLALQKSLASHNCRPGPEDGSYGLRSEQAAVLFNLVAPASCARLNPLDKISRSEPPAEWKEAALANLEALTQCSVAPACGTPPSDEFYRDLAKGCWYKETNPDPNEYATWEGTCDAEGYISGFGKLTFHYPVKVKGSSTKDSTGIFSKGTSDNGEFSGVLVDGTQITQTFKNAIPDGPIKQVSADGDVRVFGNYSLGKQTGEWVRRGPKDYYHEIFYDKGKLIRGKIRYLSKPDGAYTIYEGELGSGLTPNGYGKQAFYSRDGWMWSRNSGLFTNGERNGAFRMEQINRDGSILSVSCSVYAMGKELGPLDTSSKICRDK